jgi:HAD domain in Swiss Army Knife RNA repair proteins
MERNAPNQTAGVQHEMTIQKRTDALLFLDIDDVLCLSHPYGGYDVLAPEPPHDLYERLFSAEAVAALLSVMEAHDPTVVISSSWSRVMDRERIAGVFETTGLGRVVQRLHSVWRVPYLSHATRYQEISAWLAQHHRYEAFVVLDDSWSGTGLAGSTWDRQGRVVLCEPGIGLTADHAETISTALAIGAD